ncbi:MAG: phage head-tail joining protein [Heliomarina sp.]|uniref:phage head-tail joining protein n=1 Tax=Heliomarina sp. TaxID=2917556 RepID=UPI004057D427
MDTPEQELARLKSIKRSGVLRVEYEGKVTVYRSMAELNNAIFDLETEIATASGKRRPNVMLTRFSRG